MTDAINIPKKVMDLLCKKYNIIDTISFKEFDQDFDVLKRRLEKIKKEKFNQSDLIIIEHMDTDFYFDHCDVGVNLLNFFTIAEMVDIPKFVFLFYTNHFGIRNEISKICKVSQDQPKIIESFIDTLHYNPYVYKDVNLNIDDIKSQSLCMMSLTRSHRYAFYHSTKDIPDKQMIKSFTVNN